MDRPKSKRQHKKSQDRKEEEGGQEEAIDTLPPQGRTTNGSIPTIENEEQGPRHFSDGSISDLEIPKMFFAQNRRNKSQLTCLPPKKREEQEQDQSTNNLQEDMAMCGGGDAGNTAGLTPSNHVTPCVRGENQPYATADYPWISTMPSVPRTKNKGITLETDPYREFNMYLKTTGFLKLFGKCAQTVFRMKNWPPEEKLLEQMLNSLGYHLPLRKTFTDLTIQKELLTDKVQTLTAEHDELLTQLDQFESSGVLKELLDSDEVLNPPPKNRMVDGELLKEIFDRLAIRPDSRDNEASDPLLSELVLESTPQPDDIPPSPVTVTDKRINIPEVELLLEKMLTALGYQANDKELITELSTHTSYLNRILQAIKDERPELLDGFEDALAKYQLLDSQRLRRRSSAGAGVVDIEALQTLFTEMELAPDVHDSESADLMRPSWERDETTPSSGFYDYQMLF